MGVFNVILVFISLFSVVLSENLTCMSVLKYEPIDKQSPDRWYAKLHLKSKENLRGVWLMVVLGKKVDLLGTSFGTTTTKNNRDFMISNDGYYLKSGSVLPISFFVKHKDLEDPPFISRIYLNGRPVCMNVNSTAMEGKHETTTEYEDEPHYHPLPLPLDNTNVNEVKRTPNDYDDDDDQQCGIINEMRSPIIVYGQNTTHGQWPWHVAIKVRYNDYDPEYHYICGGTLISTRYVLTAAHCVCKRGTEEMIKMEYFSIFAGLHSLVNVDSEVQSRRVTRMVVCPEYNPRRNYIDDIALLRLQEPVRITNFVRPVCVWEGDDNIENMIGEMGNIAGWGVNENGRQSIHMMQALMPIATFDKCSRRRVTRNIRSFCAGFANGTIICNGDSGGGLVFPRRGKDINDKTVWQIRGIASTSAKHDKYCNPKEFAMFADVAKHRHWLKRYMDDGF